MLSIAKLSPEQSSYYERSVASSMEDYYAGRGEARGVWMGTGAAELGLSGELADGDLAQAMRLRDPGSGAQLRRPPAPREITVEEVDPDTGDLVAATKRLDPVAGYDFTMSVAKSLSALEAIANPATPEGRHITESVAAAHERAVADTLAYLERQACRVRLGRGGATKEAGAGFVAAGFRHRTSRERDPHLHTHVIAMNAAKGPDGKWRALDGQAILGEERRAAGYIYEAAVRREMSRRGFRFGEVTKGSADLADVPAEVVTEFSQRRRQVLEHMEGRGSAGYYGAAAAALATRAPKVEGEVDLATQRERWRARAAEHGLGAEEVRAIGAAALARAADPAERPDRSALIAHLLGPHGLTEKRNSFTPAAARQAIAAAHQQGASVAEVEEILEDLLADPRVILLEGGRYTTAELVQLEERIVEYAQRTADARVGVLPDELVERVLAERARAGEGLSAEQAAAVRAITASGRGLDVIQAWAGTGKTRALGTLADCYRAAGYRVVGAAPTGRASRELAEAAGDGRTLDRLANELADRGGLPHDRPTVLLLDEAGMAPTRPWAAVLAHAADPGARAKVVACGDSGQLQSVPAGGAFRALAERPEALRLTEVHRQRDPEHRRALAELREGNPAAYLRFQVERDLLRALPRDEAIAGAVAAWAEGQAEEPWGEVAMLCRDNRLRAELNLRAREVALRRGWVSRGEQLVVGEAESARQFSEGDRVIARRNDAWLDTDNGTRGTVVGVDLERRALSVRADDGRVIAYPVDYIEAGFVEHAYCLTGHGAQSASLEQTPAIGRPADFTAEWAYTVASREREATPTFLIDEPVEDPEEGREHRLPPPLRSAYRRYLDALATSEAERLAIEHSLGTPRSGDARAEWACGASAETSRAPVRRDAAGTEATEVAPEAEAEAEAEAANIDESAREGTTERKAKRQEERGVLERLRRARERSQGAGPGPSQAPRRGPGLRL